ncbi:hypothetical protein SASPL_101310 [Salvia splendens]|uniref:proline--tRNA ligase n=1 Tax=Salvia splendens TaxID=180675 RepID=A0A8X9AB37_SALSN|nr:hypothetical protein SASPL_101310 [Salvia splendens]
MGGKDAKISKDAKSSKDVKSPKDATSSGAKGKKKEVKKETGLGLSYKKDDNFGEWYSEVRVVVNGEMIEYYDISGCYILRPWAMSIWEIMHNFFDAEIKKMNIKNCYFPLFVSSTVLQKEKDHIEGFAPEVAWVTKSGESELEVPIAIRPTSETVMYPYFSKWIRGHRDLPLRLNQWCNVVRWEFSNPTPFIRSREFLWQEGHTAFATKEEADGEVLDILELYRRIYEEFLAVPVIKGKKSEHEKFAGGLYTTTVEAFVPNTGRGVQGATSHCLGQNFAKMFEINFENEKGERAMVWQNSWAYTTRTIGVMIMVHGDDKGLVLPPKVASLQVIVVPVPYKDADTKGIFDACASTVKSLNEAGFRAEADVRDNYSPGWKYSHWEMKGVPLRIEIGPKDLANNTVRAVRRDNSSKNDIPMADLVEQVKVMLDNIQQSLFDAAKQRRDTCIQTVYNWEEFAEALSKKKMILAPWCDEEEVEKDVKTRTKGEMGAAKSLCSPFEQPELPEGTLCFASVAAHCQFLLYISEPCPSTEEQLPLPFPSQPPINLRCSVYGSLMIDVDGSVEIVPGTSYTPPAPPAQEVNGTNQESREKDKSPSVSNCYVFKSQLQEYCQKMGLITPVYETIKEGPSHEPIFKSAVVVNNVRYYSLPGFFNRKAAEQSAAEVALVELAKSNNVNCGISQPVHETGLCKNLLQEYAQKMNYAIPLYDCHKEEREGKVPIYSCVVEIGNIKYIGASAGTKKEAEIKAARTALLAIQTAVPETKASLKPKKGRLKKQYRKKRRPGMKDGSAGGTAHLEVSADGQAGVGSTSTDAVSSEPHAAFGVGVDTTGQGGLQVDAAYTVDSRGKMNGGLDMHEERHIQEQPLVVNTHGDSGMNTCSTHDGHLENAGVPVTDAN